MTTKTRLTALAACLTITVTSLSGCQWLAQQTTPSFDPTPTSTATPIETAQERQMRLDQDAAEKAYTAANKEADRLAMAGGASKATAILKLTTTGTYLDVQMDGLRTLKDEGWRTDRPGNYTVTANGGWSPTEIGLTACEDATKVRLLNKNGKEVSKERPRRFVQTLTATKVGTHWKITDVDSKVVKTFDHESGCQT